MYMYVYTHTCTCICAYTHVTLYCTCTCAYNRVIIELAVHTLLLQTPVRVPEESAPVQSGGGFVDTQEGRWREGEQESPRQVRQRVQRERGEVGSTMTSL